jgi:hypothetical protein
MKGLGTKGRWWLSAIVMLIAALSVFILSCQRLKTAHISMESSVQPIPAGTSGSSAPRLGLWVAEHDFCSYRRWRRVAIAAAVAIL